MWRSDNIHMSDFSKPRIYCDGIKSQLAFRLWEASDERRDEKVKLCEEYNKVWRERGGEYLKSIKDCNKANINLATGRDYDTKGIKCPREPHAGDQGPSGCLSEKENYEYDRRKGYHSRGDWGTIEDWSELP